MSLVWFLYEREKSKGMPIPECRITVLSYVNSPFERLIGSPVVCGVLMGSFAVEACESLSLFFSLLCVNACSVV